MGLPFVFLFSIGVGWNLNVRMMKEPIIEFENNRFQAIVDLRLYAKDVITATIYKFSHLFYIYQQIDENNQNLVLVIFESKNGNTITADVPKQFCNGLIDQQLRHDVNAQFGHIRDMIVEEAFRPVSK